VDIYASDGPPETSARDWFLSGLLAEISPRTKDEAKAVLRYVSTGGRHSPDEVDRIMDNLIG